MSDVGSHLIEARVFLQEYPAVAASASFTVTIGYCEVSDMQQKTVAAQLYSIFAAAHLFTADPFTMTPACGYDLDYSVQLRDSVTGVYLPLPAWITSSVGVSTIDFSVQTDDPSNVGEYHISITGSVPLAFMDPTYAEELIIILNVENKCKLDEVTAD